MADSPYVFEATAADFPAKVLQASRERPVLVDFWAAWCAPCRVLMPVLAKLADEFQGQFTVVKVNTDEQQQLAQQYGVRSLPTVKVFRNGAIVDEFMGAQQESTIRALLDRHIVRESDSLHDAAMVALEGGDEAGGLRLLEQAHTLDPRRAPITIALARVLAQTGDTARAEQLLQALDPADQGQPEVAGLLAELQFFREAAALPAIGVLEAAVAKDPKDFESLYGLAVQHVVSGDFAAAMDQLLALMQRGRDYRDDLGRKTLLKLFDMLGDDPMVTTYRRKMFALLH
ncbi:MAG: thioredoxin [Thiotrichales bacterium]